MPDSAQRTLSGKSILITGGTRGIGRAIGLRAAGDGAQIAVLESCVSGVRPVCVVVRVRAVGCASQWMADRLRKLIAAEYVAGVQDSHDGGARNASPVR